MLELHADEAGRDYTERQLMAFQEQSQGNTIQFAKGKTQAVDWFVAKTGRMKAIRGSVFRE